ncbi:transposase [Erysipelotrichaceae bacterium HCN-30851]
MYTKNHRNHSTSTAKHFNMIQFLEKYYNNPVEQRNTLIKMRFPQGFVCPDCGCKEYRWLSTRNCLQCRHCSRHIHILAGTALQDCRFTFFQILLGIYLFISE